MQRVITVLLVVAIASFLSIGCGKAQAPASQAGTAKGDKALDFTLKDLKGDDLRLSEFFGKRVVILDFTTTWCPYCITIIPTLKGIAEKYKGKDVEVVAVYIREPRNSIRSFADKHGINYKVVLDEHGSVASRYQVAGVPTVIIVDKKGIIRYRGHAVSELMIEEILRK